VDASKSKDVAVMVWEERRGEEKRREGKWSARAPWMLAFAEEGHRWSGVCVDSVT
jgi:hypothetical protein